METIHSDVAVIGGGISGVSAAIAAAQEKKKVILIDRLPVIGGASVNANVGTVCGAFYRSLSSQKIAGNSFSRFFLDVLLKSPGISKPCHHQDGLYIIPYEWTALRSIYTQLLNSFNVDVRLNSLLKSVTIENGRLTELRIDNSPKIRVGSLIDCSGNAIVSQLAGLKTIKDESYQAASQIFRLKNISETSEFSLNMALKKVVHKHATEKKWPASHQSLSAVPGSIRNNSVDLKITIPEIITDKTNIADLAKIAATTVRDLFVELKNEIKSLGHAEIETIFPLPGFRVMQRSLGMYTLSENDVMACKKSDRGIAVGTWPIEEWNYDGTLKMEFFNADDGYHIPAECLMSVQIDNLFFGGRNISATSKAMASARVMGTCWQTGYAAGKLSCVRDESGIQKAIEILRDGLK